jgi:hypothetical protein
MVFAKFTVGGGGKSSLQLPPVLDHVGSFLGRKGVLNIFHPAFETTKNKLLPPFLTANAGGLCVSSHKRINISSAEKCRQLRNWKFQECHVAQKHRVFDSASRVVHPRSGRPNGTLDYVLPLLCLEWSTSRKKVCVKVL